MPKNRRILSGIPEMNIESSNSKSKSKSGSGSKSLSLKEMGSKESQKMIKAVFQEEEKKNSGELKPTDLVLEAPEKLPPQDSISSL